MQHNPGRRLPDCTAEEVIGSDRPGEVAGHPCSKPTRSSSLSTIDSRNEEGELQAASRRCSEHREAPQKHSRWISPSRRRGWSRALQRSESSRTASGSSSPKPPSIRPPPSRFARQSSEESKPKPKPTPLPARLEKNPAPEGSHQLLERLQRLLHQPRPASSGSVAQEGNRSRPEPIDGSNARYTPSPSEGAAVPKYGLLQDQPQPQLLQQQFTGALTLPQKASERSGSPAQPPELKTCPSMEEKQRSLRTLHAMVLHMTKRPEDLLDPDKAGCVALLLDRIKKLDAPSSAPYCPQLTPQPSALHPDMSASAAASTQPTHPQISALQQPWHPAQPTMPGAGSQPPATRPSLLHNPSPLHQAPSVPANTSSGHQSLTGGADQLTQSTGPAMRLPTQTSSSPMHTVASSHPLPTQRLQFAPQDSLRVQPRLPYGFSNSASQACEPPSHPSHLPQISRAGNQAVADESAMALQQPLELSNGSLQQLQLPPTPLSPHLQQLPQKLQPAHMLGQIPSHADAANNPLLSAIQQAQHKPFSEVKPEGYSHPGYQQQQQQEVTKQQQHQDCLHQDCLHQGSSMLSGSRFQHKPAPWSQAEAIDGAESSRHHQDATGQPQPNDRPALSLGPATEALQGPPGNHSNGTNLVPEYDSDPMDHVASPTDPSCRFEEDLPAAFRLPDQLPQQLPAQQQQQRNIQGSSSPGYSPNSSEHPTDVAGRSEEGPETMQQDPRQLPHGLHQQSSGMTCPTSQRKARPLREWLQQVCQDTAAGVDSKHNNPMLKPNAVVPLVSDPASHHPKREGQVCSSKCPKREGQLYSSKCLEPELLDGTGSPRDGAADDVMALRPKVPELLEAAAGLHQGEACTPPLLRTPSTSEQPGARDESLGRQSLCWKLRRSDQLGQSLDEEGLGRALPPSNARLDGSQGTSSHTFSTRKRRQLHDSLDEDGLGDTLLGPDANVEGCQGKQPNLGPRKRRQLPESLAQDEPGHAFIGPHPHLSGAQHGHEVHRSMYDDGLGHDLQTPDALRHSADINWIGSAPCSRAGPCTSGLEAGTQPIKSARPGSQQLSHGLGASPQSAAAAQPARSHPCADMSQAGDQSSSTPQPNSKQLRNRKHAKLPATTSQTDIQSDAVRQGKAVEHTGRRVKFVTDSTGTAPVSDIPSEVMRYHFSDNDNTMLPITAMPRAGPKSAVPTQTRGLTLKRRPLAVQDSQAHHLDNGSSLHPARAGRQPAATHQPRQSSVKRRKHATMATVLPRAEVVEASNMISRLSHDSLEVHKEHAVGMVSDTNTRQPDHPRVLNSEEDGGNVARPAQSGKIGMDDMSLSSLPDHIWSPKTSPLPEGKLERDWDQQPLEAISPASQLRGHDPALEPASPACHVADFDSDLEPALPASPLRSWHMCLEAGSWDAAAVTGHTAQMSHSLPASLPSGSVAADDQGTASELLRAVSPATQAPIDDNPGTETMVNWFVEEDEANHELRVAQALEGQKYAEKMQAEYEERRNKAAARQAAEETAGLAEARRVQEEEDMEHRRKQAEAEAATLRMLAGEGLGDSSNHLAKQAEEEKRIAAKQKLIEKDQQKAMKLSEAFNPVKSRTRRQK
ncbi:hypothetical protein WJX74_009300 [Apatococcus lobatus]|uniref:Uncharacterized protein n=1 Tax=Apatococcus lobatus TaxID=904363 RepID=A0AAW1Q3D9_9CHLO